MGRRDGRGPMTLAYLSVQPVGADEATGAHVFGIVTGLRALGWEVDLFLPPYRASEATVPQRVLTMLTNGLRIVARAHRYRLVYVRSSVFAWPFALAARARRMVVVHELNGPIEEVFVTWPATRRFPRVIAWLGRTQMRWSSGVIGVTPQLTAWSRAQGAPATATIPNGADVELFAPGRPRRPGLPPQYAIFFGELAPWQGIGTMLASVTCPEWPDGLALVIAGDGVERPSVEAAAARTPGVVYLGRLPRAELAAVVSNAVVGISAQNAAGGRDRSGVSPIKLFEMMAAGVPVVVSNVAGLDEIVAEVGCGVVVEAEDPAALARAVAGIAGRRDRDELGARGRAAVHASHSWMKRAISTDDFLRTLSR